MTATIHNGLAPLVKASYRANIGSLIHPLTTALSKIFVQGIRIGGIELSRINFKPLLTLRHNQCPRQVKD